MVGVAGSANTVWGQGKDTVLMAEAAALPCTLQQVWLNRRDQLGGTTLLGGDTGDKVADSLTNSPQNIQSQDEPDIGLSEECLPNLPGP